MYDDTETTDERTDRPRRATGARRGGRTPSADATGPPRPSRLYRLVRDRRGQSTTIGVALMLAVAAIGVTAIVALGGTALSNTQASADLQRTEHAMTLLDSRGAMAALGEADSQQVTLGGSGDGSYQVDPDSGWIRVVHENYTGTQNHEILNRSLGSVRYTTGDTVIAYEGGGVWRTQDNGTSMVSPPEFHYRDQTLTMPLVRVDGSGGAGGRVTAEVSPTSPGQNVKRVYPNESETYPSGDSYDNPVENGTVVVTVHSEHYKGWATYFEQRTEGELSVDHANQTASIELEAIGGAPGDFDMPLVGESIDVPSVAQNHNVSQFELTLHPDTADDNAFQQLHWSLYYQGSNGRQFELHFRGNGRCQSGSYNDEIGVSLYYRHNSSSPSEEWETTISDPNDSNDPIYVDCSSGAPVLHADLTSSLAMEYKDITIPGTDNKWHFGSEIKSQDVPSQLTVDQHADDTGHGPYDADSGDTDTLDFLIDHYFSRMAPDFELTVDAGPGNSHNRVNEELSSGTLWYDTVDGAEFIQFLHVTENEVKVELDS